MIQRARLIGMLGSRSPRCPRRWEAIELLIPMTSPSHIRRAGRSELVTGLIAASVWRKSWILHILKLLHVPALEALMIPLADRNAS